MAKLAKIVCHGMYVANEFQPAMLSRDLRGNANHNIIMHDNGIARIDAFHLNKHTCIVLYALTCAKGSAAGAQPLFDEESKVRVIV